MVKGHESLLIFNAVPSLKAFKTRFKIFLLVKILRAKKNKRKLEKGVKYFYFLKCSETHILNTYYRNTRYKGMI